LPEISIILRNCHSQCAIVQNLKWHFHTSSLLMWRIFATCINLTEDLIHVYQL
jgi:hypothetical protein